MDSKQRVEEQIRHWARELIDLSRRNRSLYFRATRGTVGLAWPAPALLFGSLMSNDERPVYVPRSSGEEPWTLGECIDDAGPSDIVTDRTRPNDLLASLKGLYRDSARDLMDRGIQTLYICFGMLHWKQRDDGDEVRTPLVFVPVTLNREGASNRFSIARSDEDVVINPSLIVLLQEQFDLDLDADKLDLQDADDIGVVFEHVYKVVRGRGWSVEPTAVLKRATFHKEAMYRDLLDNVETIAAHEIVRSLAGEALEWDIDDLAAIPDEEAVDAEAPPEDARLILDADASQRRAVEAARRGASFVMDGPPGTGKSQTIANMIAQLVADGRSVLFVSEKAAALEVVATRLQSAGLAEFALELHSHKASRKQVVQALAAALKTRVESRPRLALPDYEAARQRREELRAYAEAVNEERHPLGRSVGWVAGRLAQLAHLPTAPTPTGVTAELSAEEASTYLDRVRGLARHWAPFEDPEFAWTGYAGTSYSVTDQSKLDRELEQFERLVETLAEVGDALAYDLRRTAPSCAEECRNLLAFADHVADQPKTHRSWWSSPVAPVRDRLTYLHRQARSRTSNIERLSPSYDQQWRRLPSGGAEALSRVRRQIVSLALPVRLQDRVDPHRLTDATRVLRELAQTIDGAAPDIVHIEDALGVSHRPRTVAEVIDLAAVAQKADETIRPEASWAAPAVLRQVKVAIEVLEPLVAEYRQRHEKVMALFTDDVYDLDLVTIWARVERDTGIKKLGSVYRHAKRELAAASRSGKATKEVRSAIGQAVAAQRARRQLDAAERTYGALLGSHYQERSTNTELVSRAVELLIFAVARLGDEYHPEGVAAQLAGEGPADSLLGQRARAMAQRLSHGVDVVEQTLSGPVEIRTVQLPDVAAWARSAADLFEQLAQLLTSIVAVRHGSAALDTLADELAARRRIAEIEEQADDTRERDILMLGDWYENFDTDWGGLDTALQWTARLQQLTGGPLEDEAVEQLFAAEVPWIASEVRAALQKWDKASAALLTLFDEPLRSAHGERIAQSFEGVRDHLAHLRDRVDEPRVWLEYRDITALLEKDGWHAALEMCRNDGISARDLPEVLEQAMYAAWFDDILLDPRLKRVGGSDRDALVTDYAQRDRSLVADAAEHVIRACNARRPKTAIGAASVIRREAEKRRRHMPVRQLLAKTVEVAIDLKPCFMMSPLSVSQFLPAGYRFDVVIFDEASQITPADAINCIYRGSQLIVAGDDRQLPPTSFFDTDLSDGDDAYDEEAFDEFESVLGLCKGTAIMRSLPLRWHYRSQHESLITYSNYEFYEGDLITYPSADEHRSDLGVDLIPTDGQYRRGGRRDNPIEAATVAERVRHHAAHHPDLSLGVVAFSKAQAEAVEDAIDRLRADHPELENYFDASRLDGFFVKNLENVQGDERDIIVFTVGYGPDEAGKFTMNFGPVNREGGWRRLNVAVTRARRRVEVVTSFRPEHMDTRGSTNRGVTALQRYLDYADRGVGALAIDLSQAQGDLESPLEESVYRTIRSWGYDVVPQVGSAGYRIDLGVRDPNQPGRFMLGVECDGRAYHSSKVARDRDRLRQEVLEGLGWRLHRIWGPSWYRDRTAEQQRLQDAMEQAASAGVPSRLDTEQRAVDAIARRTATVDLSETPAWAETYVVARIADRSTGRAHDHWNRAVLKRVIGEIVDSESPINLDLISRRVADHFSHNLTARTRYVVGDVTKALARSGRFRLEDGVAWVSNDIRVRVPDGRNDATRRTIQQIPTAEIAEAVHRLLVDARVTTEEELLAEVRDLFGFRRMGALIASALKDALSQLQATGRVVRGDDGRLRPTDR